MHKLMIAGFALALAGPSFPRSHGGRVYSGGGHHTYSHRGHNRRGHGLSHRGGHYPGPAKP